MTMQLSMEQVKLLYQRSPSALFIVAIAVLVLTAVLGLRGEVPPAALALWCSAMAAVVLWRARAWRDFRREADLANNWHYWLRRFDVAVAATGLIWGLGITAFFLGASDLGRTVTLLFAVTVVATAINYLSPVLTTYLVYVAGVMSPLILACLWESSLISLTFATLSVVLILCLIPMARMNNGFIVKQLSTNFENRDLNRSLAASNRQLERDVEERKTIETMLSIEKDALEKVATGAPLQDCLDNINHALESLFPRTISSILLVDADGKRLSVGSAPALDPDYLTTLEGLQIGPQAGCCGSAAHFGQLVIARDLETDPLFESCRKLTQKHGVRACWSVPILSSRAKVLGVFTVYPCYTSEPSDDQLSHITRLSYLAGIAIERANTETALKCSEERFRDFAALGADWFWELGPSLELSYVSKSHPLVRDGKTDSLLGAPHSELFQDFMDQDPSAWRAHVEDLEARRAFELEITLRDPGKEERSIRLSGQPQFDHDRRFLGYRIVGRDITAEQKLADQFRYFANHDPMTGLRNRRAFENEVEKVLAQAADKPTAYLAFIDCDKYKFVNDSIGHMAGDRLLQDFTRYIESNLEKEDVVGRIGGDEFGMLVRAADTEQMEARIERFLGAVRRFGFQWNKRRFDVRVSVGVVPITARYSNAASLLSDADFACSRAKESGGDRYSYYDRLSDVHTRRLREFVSDNKLVRALQEERFLLYAQPIVALDDPAASTNWYEALLRVLDDDGEPMSPVMLIQAAERYGQMDLIDRWVFSKALAAYAEHLDAASFDNMRLSINLSATSVARRDTLPFIKELLQEHGIPSHTLCIEITETSAIGNLKDASNFVAELKECGCLFALDDFGAGLSSFAYLKHLPVDFLKIDGEFVRDLGGAQSKVAMVSAMNQMARALGIQTVAEWVEKESTVGTLRSMGVAYGQGHVFGAPRSFADAVARIQAPIPLRA